jgi:hypothetical protein
VTRPLCFRAFRAGGAVPIQSFITPADAAAPTPVVDQGPAAVDGSLHRFPYNAAVRGGEQHPPAQSRR